MVHESYPWKQDLRRRKYLLLRYNKADRFDANYDATYTVIEKAMAIPHKCHNPHYTTGAK